MSKAVKQESDLLAHFKTKSQPKPKNWFDKLTPKLQRELLALRKAFRAGELDWSGRGLFKEVQALHPEIRITQTGFRDWLTANE